MELPHINVKNPARCHKVEIHDLESEGENVTRTKHLFVRSSLVLLSRSFFFLTIYVYRIWTSTCLVTNVTYCNVTICLCLLWIFLTLPGSRLTRFYRDATKFSPLTTRQPITVEFSYSCSRAFRYDGHQNKNPALTRIELMTPSALLTGGVRGYPLDHKGDGEKTAVEGNTRKSDPKKQSKIGHIHAVIR